MVVAVPGGGRTAVSALERILDAVLTAADRWPVAGRCRHRSRADQVAAPRPADARRTRRQSQPALPAAAASLPTAAETGPARPRTATGCCPSTAEKKLTGPSASDAFCSRAGRRSCGYSGGLANVRLLTPSLHRGGGHFSGTALAALRSARSSLGSFARFPEVEDDSTQ